MCANVIVRVALTKCNQKSDVAIGAIVVVPRYVPCTCTHILFTVACLHILDNCAHYLFTARVECA